MAHNTRSGSSKSLQSLHDPSDSSLTAEEAEFLRKQLNEKEKQIKAQSESILARESELQKQKAQYEQTRELQDLLADLHSEIAALRDLPGQFDVIREQVNSWQNQTPTTRATTSSREDTPQSQGPVPPHEPPSSAPHSTDHTPIRLKDVADSIPRYDGQRISIFQFSKICERALDLIPPQQEPYLVQLIMNKLQGHAYTAIEGSHFTTVSSLMRQLKQIFGPNKSLNQYKGELGNAYMKPNESIFDFIARIKELRAAIIDGESHDDWVMGIIDHDVLESFVNGLPPELLVRVKLEGFQNLDDAYIKAIQVSKTMETESLRRKASFANRQPMPLARQDAPLHSPRPPPPDPNLTLQPRGILQRPQGPQGPFIKPLIPGQPGPNAPSTSFCRYCKSQGHLIGDCEKLKNRNQNQYRAGPPNQFYAQQSKETESGNAQRAPVQNDVRRDATEQAGRRTPIVRFHDAITETTP